MLDREHGRGRGPIQVRSRSHHDRLEYSDGGSELHTYLHLVWFGPLARRSCTVDRQAIARVQLSRPSNIRPTRLPAQRQPKFRPVSRAINSLHTRGCLADRYTSREIGESRHPRIRDLSCVSSRRLGLFDRLARPSQPSRPVDGDGVSDRAWRRQRSSLASWTACRADRGIR